MKLVKVMKGLYRNQAGTVHVAQRSPWRGQPTHWEVRHQDFLGAPVRLTFRTLADVRRCLRGDQ